MIYHLLFFFGQHGTFVGYLLSKENISDTGEEFLLYCGLVFCIRSICLLRKRFFFFFFTIIPEVILLDIFTRDANVLQYHKA